MKFKHPQNLPTIQYIGCDVMITKPHIQHSKSGDYSIAVIS